jgi:hypothetical protein
MAKVKKSGFVAINSTTIFEIVAPGGEIKFRAIFQMETGLFQVERGRR